MRRAPLSNLTHDTNMTHRLHPQTSALPYVCIPLAPDYANHLSSPYTSQKWVYLAVGWLPMKLPLGSRCTFTHSSIGRFFHIAAFIHVHPLHPPPQPKILFTAHEFRVVEKEIGEENSVFREPNNNWAVIINL